MLRRVDIAIRRILAIQGVVMTAGASPLIYLGDEIAQHNDYDFATSRPMPPTAAGCIARAFRRIASQREGDASSPEGKVLKGVMALIELRKSTPALAQPARTHPLPSPHATCFLRENDGEKALVITNLSEHRVSVPTEILLLALGAEPQRTDWADTASEKRRALHTGALRLPLLRLTLPTLRHRSFGGGLLARSGNASDGAAPAFRLCALHR